MNDNVFVQNRCLAAADVKQRDREMEKGKREKIIFATKNKGKISEIKAVLGDSFEVLSMREARIDADVAEDGKSFEENAMKKAEEIMRLSAAVVLADDSGLEVDFLNKAPGIYSARFMGEDTPYDIKNREILKRLEGVDEEKRSARFVCAIAAAFPDGRRESVKAAVEGIIGYEIRGENGFGYDPIFFLPEYGKTTAELSMEEKNKISHRGKALRKMKEILLKNFG